MKRAVSISDDSTIAVLDDHSKLTQERKSCNIVVKGVKYMKSKDYVDSLQLKNDLVLYIYDMKDPLDSYVYFFEIRVANENSSPWIIKRRYSDFAALSRNLTKELNSNKKLPKLELPELPDHFEEKYGESPIFNLRNLISYLNQLIQHKQLREKSLVLYDFLEMSLLQLPQGTKKFKEGYLTKRSGGRYKENRCQIYCGVLFRRWLKRWCIINNEGIVYIIDNQSSRVRESLLFDQSFQIKYGRKDTGTKRGIILSTSTRKLHLQAEDAFQAIDWISSIEAAVKECPYVQTNRFFSFAPVRPAVAYCKWYVDGEDYFEAVCEALLKAKKEIFITDWWLSPEFYLKRPVQDGDTTYRLDKILQKVAERGVSVRIIIWREVKMVGLYNDSEYTKRALQSLSPNIKVIRHGSRFPYLWSHHEKMVIVDQAIGFMGGLDLCYGRMDTKDHPLNDPAFDKGEGNMFPGIDFSNSRNADFQRVREYTTCLLDKTMHPRMPWHDIAMKVIGEPVRDLSRHFIQYWNYAEIDLRFRKDHFLAVDDTNCAKNKHLSPKKGRITRFKDRLNSFLSSPKKDERSDSTISENVYYKLDDCDESTGRNSEISRENQRFDVYVGSKMSSPQRRNSSEDKLILTKQNPFQRSGMLSSHSKYMPPDEEVKIDDIDGKIPLKKDRSFTYEDQPQTETKSLRASSRRRSKSINLTTNFKFEKQYVDLLKNIREKEIQNLKDQKGLKPREKLIGFQDIDLRMSEEPQDFSGEGVSLEESALQLSYVKSFAKKGSCSCQVLRSASNWSLGLNSWKNIFENSIQNAYIELIQNAKHFIYIENQFFISSTAGDPVTNEIARALLLRIQKAHELKEKFRIVIFLPLLPGFEGEVDDPKAAVLRIQLYWQYQTICRGGHSLYEELAKKNIDPDQYIKFYSLRQHGKMNGTPVTEIIYIHSKLMIVDDRIVIMGSANINDRSMQGSRDSELAMVIEDEEKVTIKMNGVDTEVRLFAHSLRKELYKEHLGASEEEVEDPLADSFNEKMEEIANRNTEIYRNVFACYPDDNIKRLADVKEFKAKKNLEEYDNLRDQIRGYIVQFPLKFLEEAYLNFAKTDKESIVPAMNFT